MDLEGWNPDPYGIHEERLFVRGEPTPLVRDDGIGSLDVPPGTTAPTVARRRVTDKNAAAKGPARAMFVMATLLIGAGAIAGVIGIVHVGHGGNTETTTTVNPLVRSYFHLYPSTTAGASQHNLQALPTTTELSPLERELEALPRATPSATTAASSLSGSATSRTTTATVTQPAKRPAPATAASIVVVTTLPLTTITTTVGQADLGWYLAYGSVFNTLQTDIEKLNRTLASTGPADYADVHPYWQELFIDANYAASLPPIPDAATQSAWAAALVDLSEGATDSILGSGDEDGDTGSTTTVFTQGAAFVTAGTTQLDGALNAVESLAAATSVSSRSAVRAWDQSHGTVISTLQTDIGKLNSVFSSTDSSDYSAVDPYWQQLSKDAQSAMALPPIPDPLIQSYWTTALNDLVQGSSDCLGSSEALPPNLFDQGVATISSGMAYLTTSAGAVQSLVG